MRLDDGDYDDGDDDGDGDGSVGDSALTCAIFAEVKNSDGTGVGTLSLVFLYSPSDFLLNLIHLFALNPFNFLAIFVHQPDFLSINADGLFTEGGEDRNKKSTEKV